MEVLEIGSNSGDTFSREQQLYSKFEAIVRHNVNVFSTWCCAGNEIDTIDHFELKTTSKDLHLGFGRLGENGRWSLCLILEKWFRANGKQEVIFRIRLKHEEEGKFRSVMLVSRLASEKHVTFHCSPAH